MQYSFSCSDEYKEIQILELAKKLHEDAWLLAEKIDIKKGLLDLEQKRKEQFFKIDAYILSIPYHTWYFKNNAFKISGTKQEFQTLFALYDKIGRVYDENYRRQLKR